KGAAAFVVNSGTAVSVFCLHEREGGQVRALVKGREIKLHAGEMLVTTPSQTPGFAAVNPVPGVAVRKPTEHELADGSRLFLSDFSIVSAMTRLETLRALANSPERRDRAIFCNLLKDAAALHVVTAYRGPYKP